MGMSAETIEQVASPALYPGDRGDRRKSLERLFGGERVIDVYELVVTQLRPKLFLRSMLYHPEWFEDGGKSLLISQVEGSDKLDREIRELYARKYDQLAKARDRGEVEAGPGVMMNPYRANTLGTILTLVKVAVGDGVCGQALERWVGGLERFHALEGRVNELMEVVARKKNAVGNEHEDLNETNKITQDEAKTIFAIGELVLQFMEEQRHGVEMESPKREEMIIRSLGVMEG